MKATKKIELMRDIDRLTEQYNSQGMAHSQAVKKATLIVSSLLLKESK